MAGCGRIDHDQVSDLLAFELFDLAEHEHVADTGDGGRDDVDHPGADQTLGDPPQPVVF
jgi:hypothetical protein